MYKTAMMMMMMILYFLRFVFLFFVLLSFLCSYWTRRCHNVARVSFIHIHIFRTHGTRVHSLCVWMGFASNTHKNIYKRIQPTNFFFFIIESTNLSQGNLGAHRFETNKRKWFFFLKSIIKNDLILILSECNFLKKNKTKIFC